MVNCVRMDPCSPHRFFLPLFGWNQYDVNQTHCDSDHIYTRGYQQFISIQFIIVLIANIVLYAIVMRIAMKTAKCRRIMDSVIIHNRSERDFQKLKNDGNNSRTVHRRLVSIHSYCYHFTILPL